MFKRWSDALKSKRAVSAVENDPVRGPALRYMREVLNDRTQGVGKYWSEEGKPGLIADVLADIDTALSNPEGRELAVRMRTIEHILGCADFQVLVIEPAPADDPTGLRAVEGITGALKAHLPAIVEQDDSLRAYVESFRNRSDDAEQAGEQTPLWDIVLMRYFVLHFYMSTFNCVRVQLGDYNRDRKRDWFKPALTSSCIFAEANYRKRLGLSSALPQADADMRLLMHSTWANRAQEGHADLRSAWSESWRDVFDEPSPFD
jgi:hypothetical protein